MKFLAVHEAAYMIRNSDGRFTFNVGKYTLRQNGEKIEEAHPSKDHKTYVNREWVTVTNRDFNYSSVFANKSKTLGINKRFTVNEKRATRKWT